MAVTTLWPQIRDVLVVFLMASKAVLTSLLEHRSFMASLALSLDVLA